MAIDLDPVLILKSPWLWDAKTIAWAEAQLKARDACLPQTTHEGTTP
jgi:hypothetical protein